MADVSLNGLKVKTDSLPNDWYVSLINPQSGEPAEIMTVAKFVELVTPKQPEVTESSKGLMSPQELMSNPGNYRVNRKCLNIYLESKKAYRIKINKSNHLNFRIKLFGRWLNGMPHGVIYKEISYANGSARESRVNIGNKPICSVYYISDPYISGESIYVDIINKANGENEAVAIIEYCFNFSEFEFIENQIPRTEDLDKNNRDETDFELKSSVNTLATSPNALTDTISNNYPISPPPANCVPNYSESAGSEEQFAVSAISETDNPDGSIPVKTEPSGEQYVWSIDKIGKAVLELQEENKRLKQILNISDDSEVQQM
ncbi:hypothetical protein AAA214_05885 [Parabacteroides goldsteinii]|uniref:hypothetical protein n=1 Tax=Parabacteroides goldsteinii TaxID=328812 RepID=UPI0032C0E486